MRGRKRVEVGRTFTFNIGDRVRMRSGMTPTDGREPPILHGTVDLDPHYGMFVRWDDWPFVTCLPNPNVEGEPS